MRTTKDCIIDAAYNLHEKDRECTEYSCNELRFAGASRWLIHEYSALFCPDGVRAEGAWLEYAEFKTEEERREWQLTALCFLAAMVEDLP